MTTGTTQNDATQCIGAASCSGREITKSIFFKIVFMWNVKCNSSVFKLLFCSLSSVVKAAVDDGMEVDFT